MYAPVQARESSFVGCADLFVSPRNLAQAGFFYIPSTNKIHCFHCGIAGLRNWSNEDDLWTEHAQDSPECKFDLFHKGVELKAEDESPSTEAAKNKIEMGSSEDKHSKPMRVIEDENSRLKEQLICKVCVDQTANMFFFPCGHLVCCKKCTMHPTMVSCPMCRKKIEHHMKVRFAGDSDISEHEGDRYEIHQVIRARFQDGNGADEHLNDIGNDILPEADLPAPRMERFDYDI